MTKYFIIRTGWLFGAHGDSNARRILNESRESAMIHAAGNQYGSPTYTVDLAELVAKMLHTEKYGLYHATNEGVCSRAQFADELIRQSGRNCLVRPVPLAELSQGHTRQPANMRLDKSSLDEAGFPRLPEWHIAVDRFLREIGEKA